jgi:SAM-dependent methyltransferase
VTAVPEAPSQRAIYDARYRRSGYDNRSAVRVLTAEADAIRAASRRALASCPDAAELSMFDFGYGTGRVVNEFADEYPRVCDGRPLRVVAYDVSSVGLAKAAERLVAGNGFRTTGLTWRPLADRGYVAGSVTRDDVTIVFVHGSETDSAEQVRDLVLGANDGRPYLVTSSWYGGLGHVFGRHRRRELFEVLGEVTHPDGDLVVAVSGTADLVEDQAYWASRLAAGTTGGEPVEVPGDVLYETELGQRNYYHVFGTDLADYLREITGPGQRWWVEGIRLPDEEFASRAEEQANYRRVVAFNRAKGDAPWGPEDYRRLHTVAGFRSSAPTA